MTNLEHKQSMSLEDFAEWLDEHGQFDDSPWLNWFTEKYCTGCESIKCKYKDVEQLFGFDPDSGNREMECSYCEVYGKCKFFEKINDIPNNLEIIKMWLKEEVDE